MTGDYVVVINLDNEGLAFAGFLVRNPANTAWATREFEAGADIDMAFGPRYKNCSVAKCQLHGGQVWLGPEQAKARIRLRGQGKDPLVMCIVCAVKCGGGDMRTVKLSDKQEGE